MWARDACSIERRCMVTSPPRRTRRRRRRMAVFSLSAAAGQGRKTQTRMTLVLTGSQTKRGTTPRPFSTSRTLKRESKVSHQGVIKVNVLSYHGWLTLPGAGFDDEKSLLMSQMSLEQRFGMSSVFVASTLMEYGGVPPSATSDVLLKEAIHVISCGYEDKTDWGSEVITTQSTKILERWLII